MINGRLCDGLAVDDRGLAYGDGLFETMTSNHGVVPFLDWHLQRLQLGCERLAIELDTPSLVNEINQLLTYCAGLSLIKIIVTRRAAGRGYKPQPRVGSHRLLSITAHSTTDQQQHRAGVSVRLCAHRLPINPPLAGIKHLSRLDNVLARSEWQNPNIAEGLMLDGDGRIVEGTMSNVFAVHNKQLLTPSLHRCGVTGIIRQFIIRRLAPELRLKTRVTDLRIDNLLQADELFICNSVMGIWPVHAIGCHHKPVGPVTRQLQQHLDVHRSAREVIPCD